MTSNKFDIIHTRIQRASTHRDELATIQTEYLNQHPIATSIEEHHDHVIIRFHATAPFPHAASILFGEWLYNLRAALDGLYYQLMMEDTGLNPPPNATRLTYPITTSRGQFDTNRDIKRLANRHQIAIEHTQPYHSTGGHTGSALWWVHHLARLDRHRHTHLLVWRVKHIKFESSTNRIDLNRVGNNNRRSIYIRHNQDSQPITIPIYPITMPGTNDHITIRRTIELDIPDWADNAPHSYSIFPLMERMANAEQVIHATVDSFTTPQP
ncbi:hypothetical protein G7Y31_06860 [Corynebacterium lizhenjunii]|uniref:Uncharacterized protein n=1 Tax=Corynebacterium lizhenjunii TaxID=2709394 RepID=A0A7T0KE69_9CORY|nr:hypothetical protein [Corynebacterium lizhenjunii]QPK78304.1 hypothetical protein G7Y31_06860 [Corynebacterium lizhenjunii]